MESPGGARTLLDIDSLTLPAAHFTAVTGASGAGKSTLLFALAGLLPPTRGSLSWGGLDIAALDAHARAAFRRERVGIVFQDLLLFDELGALANATLPCAWRRRADRATIDANARERLDWLGIDADDRRPVSTLSGGERQRVAVARALSTDPPLLFADEPTASLDRAAAGALIATFAALVTDSRRTLVVITHDPALLEAADTRIELVDGRVSALESRCR